MGNSNSKNHPHAQKIEVLDLETNISTISNSFKEASRAINIRQGSISHYFKRNQIKPLKKRYLFVYKKID
jgi:hypothetical protein